MTEQENFNHYFVVCKATHEDLNKHTQGRKNDEISKKIAHLIDILEVGEKFYIPSLYKSRTVTYITRTFHKVDGNTRCYKIKQVIKNEKYAVIRIR
jgi:hypothetical protein